MQISHAFVYYKGRFPVPGGATTDDEALQKNNILCPARLYLRLQPRPAPALTGPGKQDRFHAMSLQPRHESLLLLQEGRAR